MKYICAQPDELYYAWQIEVMLDNFLSVDIKPEDIHIVVGINKHIGSWWNKLIEKYKGVGFFFYQDERIAVLYQPTIRPYLLDKHYCRYPELYKTVVFYHDCDILFTKIPDFSRFLNDDIWYLSDTRSYIGSEYILSKGGIDLLKGMAGYVGISAEEIILNQDRSGGAQYIIKNVTKNFWLDVYYNSDHMYYFLCVMNTDLQKWTVDMWAILWCAWKYKFETKIDPYLNFSMATDTWPKWNKNLIYHNAGAVKEHEGKLFIKDQFRNKLPYTDINPYDKQFCSHKYFEQIIKTGNNSCLKDVAIDVQSLVEQCKSIFINK